MTTRRKPPIGPLLSLVDGAGRSSEWVRYAEGDLVYCPGMRADRRDTQRGSDRRHDPRLSPCGHRWGRVARGAVTLVRVHRNGMAYAPPPSLLLYCERCKTTIEFKTHAANEAA